MSKCSEMGVRDGRVGGPGISRMKSKTQENTISHTVIMSVLPCSVTCSSTPHIFKCKARGLGCLSLYSKFSD